jgi:hypothetical protein
MYSFLIPKDLVGSLLIGPLIKINPDRSLNRMLLDVWVFPKKKCKKKKLLRLLHDLMVM